ncbi:MAG: hypothetical protein SF172_00340 [Burkholderiales bacterium]|nr:hypothetical protein [Burkholderiales bacterium]
MHKNLMAASAWWRAVLSMLGGAIAGAAIVHFGIKWFPRWFDLAGFDRADGLWLIVSLPVIFLLCIALHELGHLAGAMMGGFRFRVLTIGPWTLIDDGVRLRHRLHLSVMRMIGGQQISSPPPGGATDRQFIVYLLGGGLANVMAAGAAIALASSLSMAPFWAAALLVFACLNAFFGVINLLPLSTAAGIRTDGYQIRTLHKGGEDAVRFRAVFAVIALAYAGIRPREWPVEAVRDMVRGEMTPLERALAELMRLQVALDRNDAADAASAAAHIVERYGSIPQAIRAQFAAELTHYFAVMSGDAGAARRYAEDVSAGAYLISPATVHRGKAAALFAEGRLDEALAEIDLGLSRQHLAMNEFDRQVEPEWLGQLKQSVMARQLAQRSSPGTVSA